MVDRPKGTVWRMMLAVAFAALFLLMTVIRGLQDPGASIGATIVGACVLVLAGTLTRDRLAREKSEGLAVSRSRGLLIVLSCSLEALATIGVADFTFWIIQLPFFPALIPPRRHQVDARIIGMLGLLLGCFGAMRVAVWMTKFYAADLGRESRVDAAVPELIMDGIEPTPDGPTEPR